jgi:hypothetical protein
MKETNLSVFLHGVLVSEENIKLCVNLDDLRTWKSILDSEITVLDMRIYNLKLSHKEEFENKVSFQNFSKTKSYRKVLGRLAQCIQNKSSELKTIQKQKQTHRINNEMDIKIMFWKNKCLSLAPEKIDEFCLEINSIIDKIRNNA